MFFEYREDSEIMRHLRVPKGTFAKWKMVWKHERDELSRKQLQATADRHEEMIDRTIAVGIPIIHNQLHKIANSDKDLTVKDLKDITDIMMSFDKLKRLDAGQATDIVQEIKPITVEQLREAVLEDKFIDVIPLKKEEYKNVGDNKDGDRRTEVGTGKGKADSGGSEGGHQGDASTLHDPFA